MKYLRFIFFSSFFLMGVILLASPTQAGVTSYVAEFWNLGSAQTSPSMPSSAATFTTTTNQIFYRWGDYSPSSSINVDGFVARFTQTTTLSAGTYNFTVNNSDDGVRVYVDDDLIINSWIDQGGYNTSTRVTLDAGVHTIKVEYYENSGGAAINFSYYLGSGTALDPYLLSSCSDLQNILGYSHSVYYLNNDIDCSSAVFAPIDNFYGVFDGRGHTISGLNINVTDHDKNAGLFSTISEGAAVVNVHLDGGRVNGIFNVGTLAGMANAGSGLIYIGNVTSNITVSTTNYSSTVASNIGGLVGYVGGKVEIDRCAYTGTITGGDYLGGLIGALYSQGFIENSYFSGDISGRYAVGGLAGYMEDDYGGGKMISNSYSAGSVKNYADDIGGLVGHSLSSFQDNLLSIENSFSVATLTSTGSNIGAIVGQDQSGIILENNWFDIVGSGTSSAIGLSDASSVNDSQYFSTASTPNYLKNNSSDEPIDTWDFINIWNIAENSYPVFYSVASDYYDLATGTIDGVSVSALGSGLGFNISWNAITDTGNLPISYLVQVKLSSTTSWNDFLYNGSTASTSLVVDLTDIYSLAYNTNYDVRITGKTALNQLEWTESNNNSTGDVVVHSVASCSDLLAMDHNYSNIKDIFELTGDIDCADEGGNPISIEPIGLYDNNGGWDGEYFNGILDGNNYTISGLAIEYSQNSGLFYGLSGATVKDLKLSNGSVGAGGDGNNVGAVAGAAVDATLTNIHSDWVVSDGYYNVGGLVGYGNISNSNFTMENCSSTGSVTSNGHYTGGLIGLFSFAPSEEYELSLNLNNNSYVGPVYGEYAVGGLVGKIEYINGGEGGYDNVSSSISVFGNYVSSTRGETYSGINGYGVVGGLIGEYGAYSGNFENTFLGVDISSNTVRANVDSDDAADGESINMGGLIGSVTINDAYYGYDSTNTLNISSNDVYGRVAGGTVIGGLIGNDYLPYSYEGDQHMIFSKQYTKNKFVGEVVGAGDNVGGLIGQLVEELEAVEGTVATSTLFENYVSSTISSTGGNVGGLIGNVNVHNTGADNESISISNSYFSGNIVGGGNNIGGLVGYSQTDYLRVNNVYAAGLASTSGSGIYNVGGLVGNNSFGNLIINNSFAALKVANDQYNGTVVGVNSSTLSLAGVYYDASLSPLLGCVDGNSNEGCTSVNTNANSSYFYSNDNEPLHSWDFSSVWRENNNLYPTLAAFNEASSTSNTYTLTYLASAGGTISGSATQTVTDGGDGSTVTAVSNSGYQFVNWSDGSTSRIRTDMNITSDHTYTANFSRASSGSGSYTPSTPKVVAPPKLVGNSINSGVNNVAKMAISTDPSFTNISWVPYNENYKTTDKTIYVKFMSADGGISQVYKVEPQNTTILGQNSSTNDADSNVKSNNNYQFTRNLKLGMTGNDVKELQKFLNNNGYIVAPSGPGSLGNETTFFGQLTKKAVIKFQKDHDITPTAGYFGPVTRAVVNSLK